MDVIFVKHPVSAEQKAELLKKGKIVDAKFAAKDDKIFDADGKELKAKPTKGERVAAIKEKIK